jgi:hypothetical protein
VWYFTSDGTPATPSVTESESFSNVASTPVALPEEEEVVAVVSAPPVEDPDIVAAKEAFEKIREANSKKDLALEKQYLSKKTLATVASSTKWQPVWYKDFEFVNAVKESDAVVMSITSLKENGATSTTETVFVKEADGWKLGIAETLDRISRMKAAATSTATGTPASLPTGQAGTSPSVASTSTKPVATSSAP